MSLATVAIQGLGLWIHGYPSVPAWSLRRRDPEAEKPQGRAFDRVNRRRAGTMGRAIADASAEAMEQAGVLDTSRMASFVAMETGLSVMDIDAMVLGGHGDAMVPMIRYTTVSGIPVSFFLDDAAIERIIERTRHGGAEILALKQTSSAYGAPAAGNRPGGGTRFQRGSVGKR